MKLCEMMDRTPLQFTEGKTYLDYMRKHRPNHLQEIVKLLIHNNLETDKYLSVLNLGADMAMLQVLNYGIPEDLGEVYGQKPGLYLPPNYNR